METMSEKEGEIEDRREGKGRGRGGNHFRHITKAQKPESALGLSKTANTKAH
jgi:hypothetical protein